MSHREILPQTPTGLDAQAPIQLSDRWRRSMQICCLSVRHRKSPVVAQQIPPLGSDSPPRWAPHLGQAHLFDQSILKRLKQPFHSPLGLRGGGRDQLHPQLAQRPAKLTRRLHPGELLVGCRLGWRAVRGVLVRIERQRHSIAPCVAPEAVHRRDRALIGIEPGIDAAARIVDVGHQVDARAAPLDPVMVRSIELDQLPDMRLPRAPRSVWSLAAPEVRHAHRE